MHYVAVFGAVPEVPIIPRLNERAISRQCYTSATTGLWHVIVMCSQKSKLLTCLLALTCFDRNTEGYYSFLYDSTYALDLLKLFHLWLCSIFRFKPTWYHPISTFSSTALFHSPVYLKLLPHIAFSIKRHLPPLLSHHRLGTFGASAATSSAVLI